jgi:RNA polymerase sigma-70 factor (ECF subfamily)
VVVAAGGEDASAARAALGVLCESYWYPLYAFARRRGASPDEASDLTQGFLTTLLERRDFSRVHPDRGRFRAFLLASFKHFLSNTRARMRAHKRGGSSFVTSFDADEAERRYRIEPADAGTPETLYERRWALLLLEGVLSDLRAEWTRAGREDEFEALKSALLGERTSGGYAAIAERLGATPGAIKVAVHRLRRKFRSSLRARIAATVNDPAAVEDELRYLMRVLAR